MKPLDLDLPDLRLRLWDHGGDGRPVLFLHGFLDTGRSFDAVAAALPPEFRALCLDFRGHGASDRVPRSASYHQLDHLKDLLQTLDHLAAQDLAPAALVGYSMGGIIALLLAGTLPHLVERLLLVESLGALPESPEGQVERLGRALERLRRPPSPFRSFADPEAAIVRVLENNPGLTRLGAERMVRPVLRQRQDGRWEFPLDPRLRGPSPIRFSEEFWLALCGRVTARVELLEGEFGLLPRFDGTEPRLAAFGNARKRRIAGAGHALHVDAPEEVAAGVSRLFET
ncbi:MAG: alpha/beta hydrolase [Planctomycetes bacterium]|nr:alpha/beta hydrolase [Planctomycetota bacterium]